MKLPEEEEQVFREEKKLEKVRTLPLRGLRVGYQAAFETLSRHLVGHFHLQLVAEGVGLGGRRQRVAVGYLPVLGDALLGYALLRAVLVELDRGISVLNRVIVGDLLGILVQRLVLLVLIVDLEVGEGQIDDGDDERGNWYRHRQHEMQRVLPHVEVRHDEAWIDARVEARKVGAFLLIEAIPDGAVEERRIAAID